jgi:hypothetical protein
VEWSENIFAELRSFAFRLHLIVFQPVLGLPPDIAQDQL